MYRIALLIFLILLSDSILAQNSGTSIQVSDPRSLPFQLLNEPAFLPTDRYQARYFCVLSGAPLDLPPGPGDRSFQMLQGMLGISWDPKGNRYLVKQLKLFQSQTKTGELKSRTTKRIFLLPERPENDDWKSLHIVSDSKAVDNDTERRTILHLDRQNGEGYLRNILWKSPDRSKAPFFDKAYEFRYVEISP